MYVGDNGEHVKKKCEQIKSQELDSILTTEHYDHVHKIIQQLCRRCML
jgi:hypothetical protein